MRRKHQNKQIPNAMPCNQKFDAPVAKWCTVRWKIIKIINKYQMSLKEKKRRKKWNVHTFEIQWILAFHINSIHALGLSATIPKFICFQTITTINWKFNWFSINIIKPFYTISVSLTHIPNFTLSCSSNLFFYLFFLFVFTW